jgi:hypothetical protein
MCKNTLKLYVLPHELSNLIVQFAFGVPESAVRCDLDTILRIKSWDLPFWFLAHRVWSWRYRRYLLSPLKSYLPITFFGAQYKELFNIDTVWSFLCALDFRMKNVHAFGSRALWQSRITESWEIMDSLASFYKMLLRSKSRVLRKSTEYEEYYVMGKPTNL